MNLVLNSCRLLKALQDRQKESVVVDSIADILLLTVSLCVFFPYLYTVHVQTIFYTLKQEKTTDSRLFLQIEVHLVHTYTYIYNHM